jgi:rod shape-determining protein MreD
MAVLSERTRKRACDVALAALVISLAWLLQMTVLNNLAFQGIVCNLPLTLTALWGSVFGSRLPPITPEELRKATVAEIFLHQAASGSLSAAMVGGFIGALYASVLPVYPLCFPVIGWITGYFCLRNLNRETLICIPLVLLATVAAEAIMAWQLWFCGRPGVFEHLAHIALPEGLLNALIAPFVYFPMRRWYDFSSVEQATS